MNELPIDPRTGIRAVTVLPTGRIVWPIAGGDGTEGDGGGSANGGDEGDSGDDGDAQAGSGKDTDWAAEASKWKSLARKHEAQAKANAKAADRLKELEDADKSEIQRERDKAAAAEARAKSAELRAARLEVAAAKGLSPTLAARLVGETREELEADADELLKVVKPGDAGGDSNGNGKPPSGGGADGRSRPRENLRSGAAPDAEPEENDPSKLAAMIPRG